MNAYGTIKASAWMLGQIARRTTWTDKRGDPAYGWMDEACAFYDSVRPLLLQGLPIPADMLPPQVDY